MTRSSKIAEIASQTAREFALSLNSGDALAVQDDVVATVCNSLAYIFEYAEIYAVANRQDFLDKDGLADSQSALDLEDFDLHQKMAEIASDANAVAHVLAREAGDLKAVKLLVSALYAALEPGA